MWRACQRGARLAGSRPRINAWRNEHGPEKERRTKPCYPMVRGLLMRTYLVPAGPAWQSGNRENFNSFNVPHVLIMVALLLLTKVQAY